MNHDSEMLPRAALVPRSFLGRATAAGRSAIVSWGCRVAAVGLIAASGSAAIAAPLTYSGRLDNPGNTALVGSDLGLAQFSTQQDVANNVALHAFTITTAGQYNLTSTGVSLGGIDPYVTIFTGLGAGATFFESNFVNAFSVGGDFTLSLLLAAGDYTLAVGAFANMSFAENLGVGTLGDGFTGLGTPASLTDGPYEITIDVGTGPQAVPEPPLTALCLAALAAMAAVRGRRARSRRGHSALASQAVLDQPRGAPAGRSSSGGGSPMPKHPWLAPITAAVLALTAGPVFAQRAALVQNVDDSLRNPYQESVDVGCNQFCSIQFSTVPSGRRRVVEFASCTVRVFEGGLPTRVILWTQPSPDVGSGVIEHIARITLPLARSPGNSSEYFANATTQAFYEAGQRPFLFANVALPGRLHSLHCTLTGREIAIP